MTTGYTPDNHLIIKLIRQKLAAGENVKVTITSKSMSPLLHPGDEIEISPIIADRLQPGDIITIETSSGLLTHRVYQIDLDAESIVTKGDRNGRLDSPFPIKKVVGLVNGKYVDNQNRFFSFRGERGKLLNSRLYQLARVKIRISLNNGQFYRNFSRFLDVLFYTMAWVLIFPALKFETMARNNNGSAHPSNSPYKI